MIDLHIHILHELDDGPESLEQSLEMCKLAAGDGVHRLVATPHVFDGVYNVKRGDIIERLSELTTALGNSGIDVEILPGADVHINEGIRDAIENDEIFTVADKKKHVMIELPFDAVVPELKRFIFDLQIAGITPILSHPERNMMIQDRPNIVAELIEVGSLVQITGQSLLNRFGMPARKCAQTLLRHDMVHIIASDAHSLDNRPPILSDAIEKASKLVGEDVALPMVTEIPEKIIVGESPIVPNPKQIRGFFSRYLWKTH